MWYAREMCGVYEVCMANMMCAVCMGIFDVCCGRCS